MDAVWVREVERRLTIVEEASKNAPSVERVRQMVEPLEHSIISLKETLQSLAADVKSLIQQIQRLTESDQHLTAQHDALMQQRAKDEQETHRLEVERLTAEISRLQRPHGFVVLIREKITPVTGLFIGIGAVIALLAGFLYWIKEHFKP